MPAIVLFRWVRELEVTFSVFRGSLTMPKQTAASVSVSMSPTTSGQDQTGKGSAEEPPEKMTTPSNRGDLPFISKAPPHDGGTQLQCKRAPTSFGEAPAGQLRMRLHQVLDWQQRAFCYLYEDIIRPSQGCQASWQDHISRGPWGCAKETNFYAHSFDGSLRALKEMTAKSWHSHSRLCVGLQVALRHLLFSLKLRLCRTDLCRARSTDNPIIAAVSSGKPTRHASRALRQALLGQQHHSNAGSCTLSLADEIENAKLGRDGDTEEQPCGSTSVGLRENRQASLIAAVHEKRQINEQRVPVCTAADTKTDELLFSEGAWSWKLFRVAALRVAGGCDLVMTAANGIRTSWWLLQRLDRLGSALSAAERVCSVAANALRTSLEEDWACCPILLPHPRWDTAMHMPGEDNSRSAGADASIPKLMHMSVSPPGVAYQPMNFLCIAASYEHRSALASMSRNIAACLAILRLSAAACYVRCNHLGSRSHQKEHKSEDEKCTSTMTEEGREEVSANLSAVVHLTLRHLRVAFEEGKKLEQSMRPTRGNAEVLKTGGPAFIPSNASITSPVADKTHEEISTVPKPKDPEPAQCLEVFTAVGQDSTNNQRKFEEEDVLLAAFAEDDPAVRERSRITLEELEIKLKNKKERGVAPRVLKELSIIDVDNAGDHNCENNEEREIKRIVKQYSTEAADTSIEQSVCEFPKCISQGDDARDKEKKVSSAEDDTRLSVVKQEAGSILMRANSAVPKTLSQSEEHGFFRNVSWLDDEHLMHRCRGKKRESVPLTPEAAAANSVISQLQSALKVQTIGSRGARDLLRFAESSLETRDRHQEPGSKVSLDGECPTTFGDDIADDEWDACDVVKGANYAAEAPTWVAACSESPDSATGSVKEKKNSADWQVYKLAEG